jgi:hypothetical protein
MRIVGSSGRVEVQGPHFPGFCDISPAPGGPRTLKIEQTRRPRGDEYELVHAEFLRRNPDFGIRLHIQVLWLGV